LRAAFARRFRGAILEVMTTGAVGETPSKTHPRAAALAFAVSAAFFALIGSGVLKCPFNALFHFPCPACGSSRAAHALMDLDFHEAMRTNPLAPLAIVLMLATAARAVFVAYRDGSLKKLGDGRIGEALVYSLSRLALLSVALWALRALGLFGGLVDQNV
jgi:hypothetical protein